MTRSSHHQSNILKVLPNSETYIILQLLFLLTLEVHYLPLYYFHLLIGLELKKKRKLKTLEELGCFKAFGT